MAKKSVALSPDSLYVFSESPRPSCVTGFVLLYCILRKPSASGKGSAAAAFRATPIIVAHVPIPSWDRKSTI
jgi:hypothetical protein